MGDRKKVYTYTRVSTAMQVEGYSLDAQKEKLKTYAECYDYEIVGEYEDAGKSGKSIEGRVQFNQMMDDIMSGKDGVSYVLVFKLSRFGRNAADVLSTLQTMQDFGVNLICVEDGIDSSKDAGKLMISVLSAVAEIERENIRVQTMEGRIQKAREGKWNGGFAPYGYKLVDGCLEINEEEAEAIRLIFDQYVNSDMGANGLAKYLANNGIQKIQRQNGKNPLFDAALIRKIIKNPVYCGKIAYGRRKTEKKQGTRNDYHMVEQENFLLVDGVHQPIVSEELWQAAQVKLLAMAKKYEHVNRGKDTRVHLLSGIVKCPVCGAGMYGNKCSKRKPDGTKYKDFFYYGCKHRALTRGHKCDYKKQINEELLDNAVAEVITKLVRMPKFAAMMQDKINMQVDTSAIEQELQNYEKQLRQAYATKAKLTEEIDSLDLDDRHYIKRKADLDERLNKMYDKIEDIENLLIAAKAKKQAIEAEKMTSDNIYRVLVYFEKLYAVMSEIERRQFMEMLVSEVQIYEKRQTNGQWLKSIKFRLPIIEEDISMCLDNDCHMECVVLMSRDKD
ncbi:MAG: recombinase family protein [Ruminococcus sp.]|nr:recombinase family protein [Ruminococcus sp.]